MSTSVERERDFLATYVNDHLVGATAGSNLAHPTRLQQHVEFSCGDAPRATSAATTDGTSVRPGRPTFDRTSANVRSTSRDDRMLLPTRGYVDVERDDGGDQMPRGSETDLPGTLKRSPAKARRTFKETLDSAHETYGGDEERAHRTAYSALKHSFEKVGDHWEPKKTKGPSDERAARRGRGGGGRSAGGVDVRGHSRDELYERARKLGVKGRSSMNKQELAEAIARKQD
jgi:cation transport regulator ChaB